MRPLDGEVPLFVQDSRAVDVTVISDTHLGTYDCHAKELLEYLNSIHPKDFDFEWGHYRFLGWEKMDLEAGSYTGH